MGNTTENTSKPIRISADAYDVISIMHKTTGASYQHIVDRLVENHRRAVTLRVELDKLIIEHAKKGDTKTIELINRLQGIIGK